MRLVELLDRAYERCRLLYRLAKTRKNKRLVLSKEKKDVIHVLLNGPSVKDSLRYVEEIKGDIMMVNGGAMAFGDKILPDYYCLADPGYFSDHPAKIVQNHLVAIKNYTHQYIMFTTNDRLSSKIDNCKHMYVNNAYENLKYVDVSKYYKDNTLVPGFQTVAVMAIYVAIQMGYQTVYVHGLDFDFLNSIKVDAQNRVYMVYEHFYDAEKGYLNTNLYTELCANTMALRELMRLREYADNVGVQIFNMNPNSMVDCFEKNRKVLDV